MDSHVGKSLIGLGCLLIIAGILWTYRSHIPWIGWLPGDIYIKKDDFQFYFPLTTSILVSVLVSFILYLFRK